eukprot:gene7446-10147_t
MAELTEARKREIDETMNNKLLNIAKELEIKNFEADNLLSYINQQQQQAFALEEKEAEELKKRGIIIGQHIPSLKSKLNIDKQLLANYGALSSNMLIAKDLIDANLTEFNRRCGNLPISDLAAAKQLQHKQNKAQEVEDVPHYTEYNSNTKLRQENTSVRFQETLKNHETKRLAMSSTIESKVDSKLPKNKTKIVLSAEKRIENENILKSINHKLNYLKNPRNHDFGVTKMLTKSKAHFEAMKNTMAEETSGLKSYKQSKITNNPLFIANPSSLNFSDYNVGEVYSQTLSFRNISAVSRSLRLFQPRNGFFSFSPLRYPANANGGMVAPGMSVVTTVQFKPTSLGDFIDEIRVDTESGSFEVRLSAKREPPNLSLSSVLDIGNSLVGDAIRVSLLCMNTGGVGRFRLASFEEIPNPNDCEVSQDETVFDCLRIKPFTIYPTEFMLNKDESVELNVEFVPLTLGIHRQSFYIKCDNGQVRNFTVQGFSKQVNVLVTEINSVEYNSSKESLYQDIYFPPACINYEQSQHVMIANETGLPIEYEWVWINEDVPQQEFIEVGQQKLRDRISASRNRLDSPDNNLSDKFMDLETPFKQKNIIDFQSPDAIRSVPDNRLQLITPDNVDNKIQITPNQKKSLLKSLSEVDVTSSFANRVACEGFELFPARGVINVDGSERFNVAFTPSATSRANLRAVMMIKSIPISSYPSSNQELFLNQLVTNGHGEFPQLCSELEQMGFVGKVDSYIKNNGDILFEKPLLSIYSLIQLVSNQIQDDTGNNAIEFQSAIVRIANMTRKLIDHLFVFRKNQSRRDDDSTIRIEDLSVEPIEESSDNDNSDADDIDESENELNEIDPIDNKTSKSSKIPILVELYEWINKREDNKNDQIEHSDPKMILPMKITEFMPGNAIHHKYNRHSNSLSSFNSFEENLLKDIFVDVPNSLLLLGTDICNILNYQVKHEAIEYLKDNSLMNVPSINFLVSGEGMLPKVKITPPLIKTTQYDCDIGSSYQKEIIISNHNSTTIEVNLSHIKYHVERIASSFSYSPTIQLQTVGQNDSTNQTNINEDVIISFNTPFLILMPNTSATVICSFIINNIGHFSIIIDLTENVVKPHNTLIDNIYIEAFVNGPKIRFDVAEIDLGLVAVGEETKQILTFRNESNVPAVFYFKASMQADMINNITANSNNPSTALALGSARGSIVTSGSNSGRQRGEGGSQGQGGMLSSRSQNSSRLSTFRSEDGFSLPGSQNGSQSSDNFHIDLKFAVITIEPSNSIIEPNQAFSVTIIGKTGKSPQRIRGIIECRLFDFSNRFEIVSNFLNIRGEVQSPSTIMTPINNNLGIVYVGIPIIFTVYLENLCNLPTKYKISRPGGPSTLYKIEYQNNCYKGTLLAKERIPIIITFTALQPGSIDDIISNKIFGAKYPLGFSIKAIAKTISLEFINLPSSNDNSKAIIPLPLGKPTDPQYYSQNKVPDPQPIYPLVIGDVPLYERRKISFVIRNLSAIPITFEITPKKYKVLEKLKKQFSKTTDIILKKTIRNDLLLTPHEDGLDIFHSAAGKEYLNFDIQRQEDKKFLKNNLGASYEIDVRNGIIQPWQLQVVTINAYNDIPGCYDDEIICTIQNEFSSIKEGIPILAAMHALKRTNLTRSSGLLGDSSSNNELVSVDNSTANQSFYLPIKMTIIGCPMIIEKNSLGMSKYYKNVPKQRLGAQLLLMGSSSLDGEILKKEFYVRNNGSKPGKIMWNIESVVESMKGPLKISITGSKVAFQHWSDITNNSPYTIEPISSIVKPYDNAKFIVTLPCNNKLGKEVAKFTGSVVFEDDLQITDKVSFAEDDELIPSKQNNKFKILLFAEGEYQNPCFLIDKNKIMITSNVTKANSQMAINLKAISTSLFEKKNNIDSVNNYNNVSFVEDVCVKTVSISNPLATPLQFSLSIEGPYVLKDPSLLGIKNQNDTKNTKSYDTLLSSTSKTTIDKMFSLAANASTTISISFQPKRDAREKLFHTLTSNNVLDSGKPVEQNGYLIINCSTGQILQIPILTNIVTPFLNGSSPKLFFGVCHTMQSCSGTFLLSNPTNVPAVWTVTHVEGGGIWKKSSAIRVKGFDDKPTEVDDPSVFTITPSSGAVMGPTLSTASAIAAPPKDLNRRVDTIVPQRLVQSSWASNTLTLQDSLQVKHQDQHQSEADMCFPMPLIIHFHPKKNCHYLSRFRFVCEFGNVFDLLLQGEGTYEEHLHKPISPIPR